MIPAQSHENGWAVVQPAINAWKEGEPEFYAAGSQGPKGAGDLLIRDGRQWLPL